MNTILLYQNDNYDDRLVEPEGLGDGYGDWYGGGGRRGRGGAGGDGNREGGHEVPRAAAIHDDVGRNEDAPWEARRKGRS